MFLGCCMDVCNVFFFLLVSLSLSFSLSLSHTHTKTHALFVCIDHEDLITHYRDSGDLTMTAKCCFLHTHRDFALFPKLLDINCVILRWRATEVSC